jgi:hypothetical protein
MKNAKYTVHMGTPFLRSTPGEIVGEHRSLRAAIETLAGLSKLNGEVEAEIRPADPSEAIRECGKVARSYPIGSRKRGIVDAFALGLMSP